MPLVVGVGVGVGFGVGFGAGVGLGMGDPVAVLVTDLDGDEDQGIVQVRDVRTGRPVGVPFGAECEVSLAAAAWVAGRPVVVTRGGITRCAAGTR
ncbi:hypothetical protein HII36_54285 [Nonomuraea sp. NN258]|uniref:hypothetical protein n=1 Tax=Nonomuraea antri TaxID=2730852 RepID=UPI001569D3C3|nr:hypothetical protein [Nonomuraea antri]NRQ40721.1 hypothetical protein [Nonomuraea antri]